MEVISLISASIVARRIINVHLWRERAREWREKKAVAFASQPLQRCHFFLCWVFFMAFSACLTLCLQCGSTVSSLCSGQSGSARRKTVKHT